MSDTDINMFHLESNTIYSDLVVSGANARAEWESYGDHKIVDYPPGDYDDLCKGSRVTGVRVQGYTIYGHPLENIIDLNNECQHVYFNNGVIGSSGVQNLVTIKGGCEDIAFHGLIIDDKFSAVKQKRHIEIGNYSAQSKRECRQLLFEDVHTTSGAPVIMRVGYAEQPVVLESNVKKAVWDGFTLRLYVRAKYFFPFIP